MPAKLRCFVAIAFGQKDTDAISKICTTAGRRVLCCVACSNDMRDLQDAPYL